MATESNLIIEVSRKKESAQSITNAPVIITSGYLLDSNNQRVEAVFKNRQTGADMTNLEIPAGRTLKFDLSNPIDAHNYEIVKTKIERFPLYRRILEVVDYSKRVKDETDRKEYVSGLVYRISELAKQGAHHIIEICRCLEFNCKGKDVSTLKSELYAYTNANPGKVEHVLDMPDLSLRASILAAIEQKQIVQDEQGRYVKSDTKFVYGKNLTELLEYAKLNPAMAEGLKNNQTNQPDIALPEVKLQKVVELDYDALFDAALLKGVIEKVNKKFYYTEIELGKTKEEAVIFLKNNPNISKTISDIAK